MIPSLVFRSPPKPVPYASRTIHIVVVKCSHFVETAEGRTREERDSECAHVFAHFVLAAIKTTTRKKSDWCSTGGISHSSLVLPGTATVV